MPVVHAGEGAALEGAAANLTGVMACFPFLSVQLVCKLQG